MIRRTSKALVVMFAIYTLSASAAETDRLAARIDHWGTTEHPAVTSPKGVRLIALRVQHPSPESVQSLFGSLNVPLTVQRGPEAALIAVLDSPRGRVELR